MEHVVCILGAGFSAPLGLPVIRNFLLRAKDLYFSNSTQYGYFSDVFKRIDDLARLKNVFTADLLNIEEILSYCRWTGSLRPVVSSATSSYGSLRT
jgi:NAD-dependent SIR2 family protein deacetylase